MANSLFPKAREGFLTGTRDWTDGRGRALLYGAELTLDRVLSGDYVYVDDLDPALILARSSAPAVFGATDGFATSQEFRFVAFSNPVEVKSIVLFFSDPLGGDSTSLLIGYIDVASGIPFTGTGEDYAVTYDASFGGYFRL